MLDHETASILKQTLELRHNREPTWIRLRELLNERGLDLMSIALVEFFPDDSHFKYGVITTANGQVYKFGFDHLRGGPSSGVFSEWRECVSDLPHPCTVRTIEIGVKVARGETDAL